DKDARCPVKARDLLFSRELLRALNCARRSSRLNEGPGATNKLAESDLAPSIYGRTSMSRAPADIPGLEGPAPARSVRRRHALGLPAGSVRALLTSIVFGLLAAIMIVQGEDRVPTLYTYLWYLLLLIIAHYFAAHGNSIRSSSEERSPLGLPRGFFRFLF